jgi:hypothetical protein
MNLAVPPQEIALPVLIPPKRRESRSMNNRELADGMCEASTALREARRVHVSHFGALIPHVFMGDVLARVGRCLGGDAPKADESVREISGILDAIERGMATGDRETRNVISISFVGDGELEKFFLRLVPLLGPATRAQMQGK